MPYRNDVEALQDRLQQLEDRLAGVRARRAAAVEAAREEPDLVRDLDRVRREVAARTRLPLLRGLEVATPCDARWDAMEGDDRVRFCGDCKRNVYNLSAMTGEQAEALLAQTEGRLCVRYYRRADGTVLTADCPTGVRRRRIGILAAVGTGLALATAGVTGTFLQVGRAPSQPPAAEMAPPTESVQGGASTLPVAPPPVTVDPGAVQSTVTPAAPPIRTHMGRTRMPTHPTSQPRMGDVVGQW